MTEIYFIRHAESYGNVARRVYGWYDGLVTPKGYTQINALRKRFEAVDIDVVYSSDLTRTVETARAIYEPKRLPLNTEPGFREIHFGVWEDACWGELISEYKEMYDAWIERPLQFEVENAETYTELYARAKTALMRIISENEGKSIAIVSHGAVLRVLMHGIMNGDDIEGVVGDDWGDNTCVSLFRYDGERFFEVYRNSDEHLKLLPGYGEGIAWVREGGGRNVHFVSADAVRDREKINEYHRLAWKEIFDDDINIALVEKKTKRLLKKDRENVVFGILGREELGMVELDGSVKLHSDTGHISFVYLKPEYRRQRFGIQLIGHAMSKYKREGKKHISVRVAVSNTAAYKFYTKYGFYEIFRENDDGIEQRVMILDI